MSRRTVLTGATAAAITLAHGCTAVEPRRLGTPSPKRPRTLHVHIGPSPSLHPHDANVQLVGALHAPLVGLTDTTRFPTWGDAAPGALVRTISTADSRRWEVRLKEGRTWHDGAPVTAEDVRRGWDAAIAAGQPIASTLQEVRVLDKHTVAVALAGPYGALPALLADPRFLPLPASADADPTGFAASSIGTGPFRLTDRDGDLLHLESVPGHPTGPVGTDRIVVDLGATAAQPPTVAVGRDGDLTVPEPGGHVVVHLAGRQLAYVGLPLSQERYADVAVRQALSQALDRAALADVVLGGAVLPATRLLGPGMAGSATVACESCTYDATTAAARWPADFDGPLTIWFAQDSGHEPVIDFLAESWRRVLGVDDIQLASLPGDDLVERLVDGEVSGPFRSTWAADVPAATRLLQPLFGRAGTANDSRYRNDAVADLLDAADLRSDPVAAARDHVEAERQVLADLPIIPLWFSTVPVAAEPDVVIADDGLGRLDWTRLRRA